jgi:hypothetical protein
VDLLLKECRKNQMREKEAYRNICRITSITGQFLGVMLNSGRETVRLESDRSEENALGYASNDAHHMPGGMKGRISSNLQIFQQYRGP